MHISFKICASVLLLASELLCIQINFIINIGILVIKLKVSFYKFLGSFYETTTQLLLEDAFYMNIHLISL